MFVYTEENDTRVDKARECRFWQNERNEKYSGEKSEKINNLFLLIFPAGVTHTHFPEGHCTC